MRLIFITSRSFVVHAEARAVIKDAKDKALHVREGSSLKLSCHVELATEPPLYVFWFHNETMINFQASRPVQVTKQTLGSTLTISNVSRADAGVYRCEPHKARPDNVTLHVIAGMHGNRSHCLNACTIFNFLSGENSAAMQKEEEGSHFAQTSSSSSGAGKTLSDSSFLLHIVAISFFLLFKCIAMRSVKDTESLACCKNSSEKSLLRNSAHKYTSLSDIYYTCLKQNDMNNLVS